MAARSTLSPRAQARVETTEQIKQIARRHLAEEGPNLSLRAVARDLGMVSSAVYRYFASRDELLTALVVDAYEAVAAAAEAAAGDKRGGVRARWLRVAKAIREWAKANPHDYALVYGSPVPGYQAPAETIPPALRGCMVALDLVREGYESEEIIEHGEWPAARPVRLDLADLRRAVAPGVPDEILSRALLVWTQLFGTISFELFGHFNNVIHDGDAFFEDQMRRTTKLLVAGTL